MLKHPLKETEAQNVTRQRGPSAVNLQLSQSISPHLKSEANQLASGSSLQPTPEKDRINAISTLTKSRVR